MGVGVGGKRRHTPHTIYSVTLYKATSFDAGYCKNIQMYASE
ncbi:hypothetical protein Mpsy_0353 [Methanolobus psychrophilus R15]|nr:hypothetical protein Mpsy_0353 [Methanolobus psychrophilus R15]